MLVRSGEKAGIEVYMLRRSEASHFVPDVYVFPGGSVDESDEEQAHARLYGAGPDQLQREFRAQPSDLLPPENDHAPGRNATAALIFAAIRELFEEAGILLVCDGHGSPLDEGTIPIERAAAGRAAVARGDLTFATFLESIDAYADARSLALFSQWITPPPFPKRYNAHFFVARVSGGDEAVADAYETHDGLWIAPRTALQRYTQGTLRLVYPTIKHLERLARFDDAGALLDYARAKPIVPIMPSVSGELAFSLPSELEHAW